MKRSSSTFHVTDPTDIGLGAYHASQAHWSTLRAAEAGAVGPLNGTGSSIEEAGLPVELSLTASEVKPQSIRPEAALQLAEDEGSTTMDAASAKKDLKLLPQAHRVQPGASRSRPLAGLSPFRRRR